MKIGKSLNFTQEQNLVEEIPVDGFFANPAGRQGYTVVVLEKVGKGGSRIFRSLGPGETLDWIERLGRKFIVLAVDMRNRSFTVGGQFATTEPLRTVNVQAKVHYRVVDAQIVAGAVDPLGDLRDKVISTLKSELLRYQEVKIGPALIKQIIYGIGKVTYLGLMIQDAEVMDIGSDANRIHRFKEEEEARHLTRIEELKSRAKIEINTREEEAKISLKKKMHAEVDLTNINTFLHEFPEMADKVFSTVAARDQYLLQQRMDAIKPAITAYVNQQLELEAPIDPHHILNLLNAGEPKSSLGIKLGSGTTPDSTPRLPAESSAPLIIEARAESVTELSTETSQARIQLRDTESPSSEDTSASSRTETGISLSSTEEASRSSTKSIKLHKPSKSGEDK
ncbi:MAG: hypothetical protein HS114_00835 [Anaerolineales bacterium]|nr:hypothetical protein [Anaerolineales bacterium]